MHHDAITLSANGDKNSMKSTHQDKISKDTIIKDVKSKKAQKKGNRVRSGPNKAKNMDKSVSEKAVGEIEQVAVLSQGS